MSTNTSTAPVDRTAVHVARLIDAAERVSAAAGYPYGIESRYGVGIAGRNHDTVWAVTDGQWEICGRLDRALERLGVQVYSFSDYRECCQCCRLIDDSDVYNSPDSLYSENLGGDVCADCLDADTLDAAIDEYASDPERYLPASITAAQLDAIGYEPLDLLSLDQLAAVGLGELDVDEIPPLGCHWGRARGDSPSAVFDLIRSHNPAAAIVFVSTGRGYQHTVRPYVRTAYGPWGPRGYAY